MAERLKKLWRENRALVVFIVLMFMFRSAIADWNQVPTGSMKPTILEGDRILVNKMAYDLRLPFTHIALVNLAAPQRGDIIVFDSQAAGKRLVKRVVGLPGDRVQLVRNTLYINGTRLTYSVADAGSTYVDLQEDLLGVEHKVRIQNRATSAPGFALVVVPAEHYLVLGDNRDQSADSRAIGFVPRNEIVGRTRKVVLSFNYDNYYIPRAGRFMHPL